MASLGPWKDHEAAPPASGSNAYATVLATFTLQQSGVKKGNPRMEKALTWLESHQDRETGSWAADSMNKVYKPDTMMVKFMRDAATGFASMALLQ